MIPQLMYGLSSPNKVINHISPSMIGGCHRKHFYAINKIESTTPPSPGALLNFKVGFMWEEVLKQALEQARVPFIYQFPLRDAELNVEGTADFVVLTDEGWEVWDSKTESIKAHSYREREGKNFFNSHPEYVHQLNLYKIILGRMGFDIVRGRFGVIVKDNGLVSESITMFPDKSLDKTLKRVTELNKYLAKDKLPPCECEDWKVGYCSYGNVDTQERNKTGKMVNSECCDDVLWDIHINQIREAEEQYAHI